MNRRKSDNINPLGFVNMPDGYELVQLDSGHWMWVHTESEYNETDIESCIHRDKWAAYRGAKEHSKSILKEVFKDSLWPDL